VLRQEDDSIVLSEIAVGENPRHLSGSLEVGKVADLVVVLGRDPMKEDPSTLITARWNAR